MLFWNVLRLWPLCVLCSTLEYKYEMEPEISKHFSLIYQYEELLGRYRRF